MSFQVVSTRPVGALDVCDAELVNMPVERIGDAAYVPTDAKGSCIQIGGLRIAHLRHARAVQIETLVVRAGVLVVGADDIAPAAVPERTRDRGGSMRRRTTRLGTVEITACSDQQGSNQAGDGACQRTIP
jgi:hypothetical protein